LNRLAKLAAQILKDGPHKVLKSSRRIRVVFNHTTIIDTTSAVLVWEHPYYPFYYLPSLEFPPYARTLNEQVKHDGQLGATISEHDVAGPDGPKKTAPVIEFLATTGKAAELSGLTRLQFGDMGRSERTR
jgi:hypothetical protein